MSNQESVYKHRGVQNAAFDTEEMNKVISESNVLDVSMSSCDRSLELIRLRHKLLAILEKIPHSPYEFTELCQESKSIIEETIWDRESRDRLAGICRDHWKTKFMPEMLDSSVLSIKFKLRDYLTVWTLVEIGFAFSEHSKKGTNCEDFLLKVVTPIINKQEINKKTLGTAYAIIKQEYSNLRSLFAVTD